MEVIEQKGLQIEIKVEQPRSIFKTPSFVLPAKCMAYTFLLYFTVAKTLTKAKQNRGELTLPCIGPRKSNTKHDRTRQFALFKIGLVWI